MRYTVSYKSGAVCIPAEALSSCDDITALKFLMLLSYDRGYGDAEDDEICKVLSCSEEQLKNAVAYLRGNGLIEPEKKQTPSAQDRAIDGEAMSAILDSDADMKNMIDECQKICGKIFTPTDISRIIGIKKLGFDCETILLMFSYYYEKLDSCGKKLSVSYVEKSAYSLYNQNVRSFEDLHTYITETERKNSMNYKLRSLFGIGERSFTKKEKTFFGKWTDDWNMPYELIEMSFNIAVDSTGKASLEYMSKILSDWHDSGILTVEQAEAANEEYKKNGSGRKKFSDNTKKEAVKSFDTDEFFEKALQRSYAMMKEKVGEEGA